MTVVGQTPGVFVKAGAAGFGFSPACIVALGKIGLEPGDFGTYKDVRAKQEAAREKCRKFDENEPGENGEKPAKPTEHDRFIAGCQSGHLTQNATQQRKRGDACQNATPGYSDEGAPCAPQFGNANKPGTEHYIVTRQEALVRPESDAPRLSAEDKKSYPPSVRATDDADRIKAVQGAIAGNNDKYPEKLAPVKDDAAQAEAQKTFKDMQEKRKKAADEVTQDPKYKKALAATDPAVLKTIDEDNKGEVAADCIETFRQAGMLAMKKRAADPKAIEAAEKKAAEGSQPSKEDKSKTNQEIADDKVKAAEKRETDAKDARVAQDKSQQADRDKLVAEQDKAADDRKKKQAAALDAAGDDKAEKARLKQEHKAENEQSHDDDKQARQNLRDDQKAERAPKIADVKKARQDKAAAEDDANQYEDAGCRAKQGKEIDPKTGKNTDRSDKDCPDGLSRGFGSLPVNNKPDGGAKAPRKSQE